MKLLVENIEHVDYIEESVGDKKALYITGPFLVGECVNKNGRYYPMNILDREVEKYTNEQINKGSAAGELNHPCFSSTAEALTQSGWKYIKDISVGEIVYTLNPDTQKIEMQPVEQVHVNDFSGNMIRIKNRTFDTIVTPKHKFIIFERNGKSSFITAEDIKWGLDNRISRLAHCGLPKCAKFERPKQEKIDINGLSFDTDIFASFLGIYLSEGCTTKRKGYGRNNSYVVSIFQNIGENEKKIQKLLDSMNLKWGRIEKNNKVTWRCCERKLAEFLYPLGNCYSKYIPQEILDVLDEESAKNLLSFFIVGDGRGELDKKYARTDVFSVSERLINDLSVVAVQAGYAFRKHQEITTEDYIFANRVIKAENKKPLHFIQLYSSQSVMLDGRFMSAEYVPYEGKIYCLTTKNSTFMARDNGMCFWTGNSTPNLNLDRISHIITELKRDGNNYIGKARIAESQPMGKIARGLILDEKMRLGVSSRGVGSLKPHKDGYQMVADDFSLSVAADLVSSPSAPGAFVKAVMEESEWLYDAVSHTWQMSEKLDNIKKELHTLSKQQIEDRAFHIFEDLLSDIAGLKHYDK